MPAVEPLEAAVSIRASRAGGDRRSSWLIAWEIGFNPRLPRGRRPSQTPKGLDPKRFNPRLPRGRRQFAGEQRVVVEHVSIRASRAGGDDRVPDEFYRWVVSIRASRAGGDCSVLTVTSANSCFNPRLPRGRRLEVLDYKSAWGSFNPRLPRGRRPSCWCGCCLGEKVSIRASRAGGDSASERRPSRNASFNPRLPRGRRRPLGCHESHAGGFNPRLPRGRRPSKLSGSATVASFNPRLPRGRRLRGLPSLSAPERFQSAPPAREATAAASLSESRRHVSIRASRAGGDSTPASVSLTWATFQSAPPAREATELRCQGRGQGAGFNPRLPRGRRHLRPIIIRADELFQSAPPAREATYRVTPP